MGSPDVARNRAFWDEQSDGYQRANAAVVAHDEVRRGLRTRLDASPRRRKVRAA
jgi:hypothetical protein